MGRQLIQAALQMDGVALGAALEREGSSLGSLSKTAVYC
jgi:4-hydroxy-tetrahydrodipicolinate reductase